MSKKSSKPTLPRKKPKPGKHKKVLERKKECLRRQREAIRAENERLEAERKAEIERLEVERKAEIERLEAERKAEIERLEAIRLAEIERLEAIRLAEIERLEAIRLAEIEAIRVEKEWNVAIRRAERDFEVEDVKNQDEGHGDHEETGGVDRLSDLPNSVIHHILIRLPVKDAAQTRALSSRWPGVWATCPILCFNEVFFGANIYAHYEEDLPIREVFAVFLAESLHKLKNCTVKYTLDHFGLRGASFDKDSIKIFNDWLDFALENELKQLDLGLRSISDDGTKFRPFRLCNNVFTSKSLTELYLEFCFVDDNLSIDLPSLRKLSLSEVKIDDHTIRNLILGCPLLEDLQLTPCSGVNHIDVSIPKLISLKINLTSFGVTIESSRLQSIEFSGQYYMPDVPFVNVKDMTLKDVTFSDDDFSPLISASPSLENLVVEGCWNLQDVRVASESVKNLVISRCKNVSRVDIDVGNLISFKYLGSRTISFSSQNSLKLVSAKITLDPIEISSDWFVGLKNLLQGLAGCKSLTMVCRDLQVMSFPFELFSELTPLVRELKHLNLETCSSSSSFNDIAKRLVWILLDLETLTIKKGSIQATIKCAEAAA